MPLSIKQIDKLLRDGKAGTFPRTHIHDEHGKYLSRDLNSGCKASPSVSSAAGWGWGRVRPSRWPMHANPARRRVASL
jgi:hypothetical protein